MEQEKEEEEKRLEQRGQRRRAKGGRSPRHVIMCDTMLPPPSPACTSKCHTKSDTVRRGRERGGVHHRARHLGVLCLFACVIGACCGVWGVVVVDGRYSLVSTALAEDVWYGDVDERRGEVCAVISEETRVASCNARGIRGCRGGGGW